MADPAFVSMTYSRMGRPAAKRALPSFESTSVKPTPATRSTSSVTGAASVSSFSRSPSTWNPPSPAFSA